MPKYIVNIFVDVQEFVHPEGSVLSVNEIDSHCALVYVDQDAYVEDKHFIEETHNNSGIQCIVDNNNNNNNNNENENENNSNNNEDNENHESNNTDENNNEQCTKFENDEESSDSKQDSLLNSCQQKHQQDLCSKSDMIIESPCVIPAGDCKQNIIVNPRLRVRVRKARVLSNKKNALTKDNRTKSPRWWRFNPNLKQNFDVKSCSDQEQQTDIETDKISQQIQNCIEKISSQHECRSIKRPPLPLARHMNSSSISVMSTNRGSSAAFSHSSSLLNKRRSLSNTSLNGLRSLSPILRPSTISMEDQKQHKSIIRQKFFLTEDRNLNDVLINPDDRRLKAICKRFDCDPVVYTRGEQVDSYILLMNAPSQDNLKRCIRQLDSTMKWNLSCQLK